MITLGKDFIAIGCDQPVHWSVTDDLGAVVNDLASISGVLKDSDGDTLATFSMTLEDETTGLYRGFITDTDTATLTDCDIYVIELTATTNAGLKEFRRLERMALYRGEV